jgi:hypothetical protein
MFKFSIGVLFGGTLLWLIWKVLKDSDRWQDSGVPQASDYAHPVGQDNGIPQASDDREIPIPGPPRVHFSFHSAILPSYQTVPLTDYRREFQSLAEALFQRLSSSGITGGSPVKYKGSYSFLDLEHRTIAKVIIYQDGLGRKNGPFPALDDGVYLLVRSDEESPNTIGVAPKHNERFTHWPIDANELDRVPEIWADVFSRH